MSLDSEFTSAMWEAFQAERDLGVIANYFARMLEEHGGVETAKRLLATSDPQTGLYRMWELNLLEKSMEAVVLQSRFRSLFTDAEIAEAHRRLEELGYFKK